MAGGTWLSQNKTLPGAYINFVSVPRSQMTVGDRGIGIIPLPLSWGAQDRLIEVMSTDMLDGSSLAKVGFTAFDAESKVLNLMLQNCYKALVFRTNAGGVPAKAELGDLTVTARYPGTLGNKIQVAIVAVDDLRFDVKTYVDARLKNTQTVAEINELIANDFVKFSGDGELEEFAGEPLSGGTDGTSPVATSWMPDFLDMASMAMWQTMAVPYDDATIKKNIVTFINDQRNNQGRYVQAVLHDYKADHEGIINSVNGIVLDGVEITPTEFTAWVAGATAGALITQSNTARVIVGATEIIGEMNHEGLVQSVRNGEFSLRRTQDNSVMVTDDINSFVGVTQAKNYAFSDNKVMRILDEIGTSAKGRWERSYMGKVGNDENGRAAYKSDVVEYLFELQRITAVQEFSGADDVTISQGETLNDVLTILAVKPTGTMKKLYMTVNVIA